MKSIKTIFFDLGKVIVNFDLAILEKGYAAYGYKPDGNIDEYIMGSESGTRYMEGDISSSDFYKRTRRSFKMDIKYNEFYEVWNSMFFPNPEVENIIKSIKKNYPDIALVLMSDTNEAHYNFLKERYEVLGLIDHNVLSYKVGRLKPHPDMFKEGLRLTGSLPKEVFYTDDRLELIEAARIMGIRAFQFTGHEALLADLAKVGINV